jgi:uncharacterized membrane protein
MVRSIARVLLGSFLIFAGIGHLTFARADFQAQVPEWLPLNADFVVLASGAVELVLGLALVTQTKHQAIVGVIAALFFVGIFAGNINQYVERIDAFGLNSDEARLIRLFFQPLLVFWALWSTNAWQLVRQKTSGRR